MKKRKEIGKTVALIFFVPLLAFFVAYWMEKSLAFQKNMQETMAEAKKDDLLSDGIFVEEKQVERRAYLTFDDGPSEHTDQILDILKEKGVKATFFVVGKEGEEARKRYQRILEEGHSLGMHSYSHDYSDIYASLENYKADLLKLQDYLYEVTGEKIKIYRFPGGSSNSVSQIPVEECIAFLKEEGIQYYDWNASSEDAVTVNASCSQLNQNILQDALRYENTMILMHDLSICTGTVEGLGGLIDRLQEEGYGIYPITEDTTPIQHVK